MVLLRKMLIIKKEEGIVRYRVYTSDKEYEIFVEAMDEETINCIKDTGEDVSFTAAQDEYNYCFQRSAKLDNKVYILLTVCAFLFVMLSGAIKKLSEFAIPQTKNQLIVEGGYIVILTLSVATFIIILVKLIGLLRGIKLSRFDSYEILNKDMLRKEKKQVIKYICMMYEQCRSENNRLIEAQYKHFNQCVKLMVINIVLLLVSAIYVCFL